MKADVMLSAPQGEGQTACRECDLLVGEEPTTAEAYVALCPRCGAHLYRRSRNSLEHTLALACAALVLLAIASVFPVVGLNLQGQHIDTTVIGAVTQLWQADMHAVSLLVLATTTVTPLVEMAGLIWLVLPLRFGRRPPAFARVLRTLQTVHPWAMVEVFILGVLVALVKLAHLAEVLPGPAMLCFGMLTLLLTTLSAVIEPRDLWQAWEEAKE